MRDQCVAQDEFGEHSVTVVVSFDPNEQVRVRLVCWWVFGGLVRVRLIGGLVGWCVCV